MKNLLIVLVALGSISAFAQETGRFVTQTVTSITIYETANFDSIRLLAATKDQTRVSSAARLTELALGRARAICRVNGLELAGSPSVKVASGGSKFLSIKNGAPEIINDGSYESTNGRELKTLYFDRVDCKPMQF